MRATYVVVCLVCAGLVACGDNLQGNREPVASDSNVTTPEDTPVSITVNATDPDGSALTFTFGSPAHGTITTSGGTVTYRPDDDYHGPDSIQVDISDGTFETSAEITITVTPVNDGPTAVDDALAANEDTAATVTGAALVANDLDVEDDALTVTAVGTPSMGTATLVGDTVTYTPPTDFVGMATFEYTVSDGALTDTGVVTVTVGGVNDPPVTMNDMLTIEEDEVGTITAAMMVSNDSDPEGQTLSVTGVSNFTNGTAVLAGGTVTFTPTADFFGTAGFDYTVSDGASPSTGHVTVTVTPVNDTPVADAQNVTVAEDGSVTITLTGSDVEDEDLTFAIVMQPAAGSLGTITPVDATSATVVYTPNPSSTAADSFTFTVTDTASATSTAATVSITVTPDNDPPVANATSAMVDEDGSVVITLSGSDIDGDSLTFETVTGPATGSLSAYTLVPPTGATVTYTPDPNSAADDSFTFRVNDGTVDSAPATVTITVIGQQDPPVANAATESTDEDTAVDITLTGTDLDGDTLTFATGTGPAHGTLSAYTQLSPTSARVTYTPDDDYNGADSFTFTVNDGTATSAPATVDLTVDAVDDAPVALAGMATVAEDGNVTITLIGTDAESQALTFSIVTDPTRGSLGTIAPVDATSATVVYTPNPNNDQNDSFTFRVTAGGVDSAPATITVIVTPSNDGPVAVDDDDSTLRDTPVTRPASFYTGNDTDVDGPALSIASVTSGTGGTASLDVGAQTVTFTPDSGFSGAATFTYEVTDGSLSATGTVTVTVIDTNTAPVAVDDDDDTAEDTALVVNATTYTANDIDPDPQTLTITAVSNPTNGTVSIDVPTQIITFTPAANFVGDGTFDYTVSDGIDTDVGTVTVDITSVDDLPVAVDDVELVPEDGTVNTNVLGNDTGLGDGGIVVTVTGAPTHGTAVAQGNNTVTYTPEADYVGADAYTYQVEDADGDVSTAVVSVAVLPMNDAPVAQGQTQTMNENTVLTVTLTGTDIDLPGQQLTFAIVTDPTNGTLGTITSTGLTTATVTYTPTADFTGADSFTFTASDGIDTSAPATVNITVNNVAVCNDGVVEAPEACDDGGNAPGDGCSATCVVEDGWSCTPPGGPSVCTAICNDGTLIAGEEECDDGNEVDTDGCTTACQTGPVCTAAAFPGGDRFATNPADGHCYISFDTEPTTFGAAQTACVAIGGHLASITSVEEQVIAESVQNPDENPWIGLTDELVEGSFGWITGEALGFENWASTQPDGGDAEDCVNFFSTALGGPGTWNDTNCNIDTFTSGRICEVDQSFCGDGITQATQGEQCDDANPDNTDGCNTSCQRSIVSIVVTPAAPPALMQQQRVQLKATGTFGPPGNQTTSDVTATASWSSSDDTVVSVGTGGTNNGRAESHLLAGPATITASIGAVSGGTTLTVGAIPCHITVNEVQVAGTNSADEWVELYNSCSSGFDVTGWTLVYRSASGTSDFNLQNLTGTIAPGAFRLYASASAPASVTSIADGTYTAGGSSGQLAGAAGGVAVRSGPVSTGTVVDSVGYGATATNVFVEGTFAAAPAANRSIARLPYDGRDSNANATDFTHVVVGATTPRTTNAP